MCHCTAIITYNSADFETSENQKGEREEGGHSSNPISSIWVSGRNARISWWFMSRNGENDLCKYEYNRDQYGSMWDQGFREDIGGSPGERASEALIQIWEDPTRDFGEPKAKIQNHIPWILRGCLLNADFKIHFLNDWPITVAGFLSLVRGIVPPWTRNIFERINRRIAERIWSCHLWKRFPEFWQFWVDLKMPYLDEEDNSMCRESVKLVDFMSDLSGIAHWEVISCHLGAGLH
jgi:hypothetical protein